MRQFTYAYQRQPAVLVVKQRVHCITSSTAGEWRNPLAKIIRRMKKRKEPRSRKAIPETNQMRAERENINMIKTILRIGCLLTFAITTNAFCDQFSKYVYADIANVRDSSSTNSKVIFRLRTNSIVRVIRTKTDWAFIQFGKTTKGWVSANLLGDFFLTENNIIDSIATSSTSQEKKKWADRLLSGFPANESNWNLIDSIYKEIKDSSGLELIKAHKEGTRPAYIAVCNYGILQLLGIVNSNGSFTSFVWTKFSSDSIDDSVSVKWPLAINSSGNQWYSTLGRAPDTMFNKLSPGPDAKWLHDIAEKHPSYGSFLTGFESEVKWFEMGNCEGSEVFSTSPIIRSIRQKPSTKSINPFQFRHQIVASDSMLYPIQDNIAAKPVNIKPYSTVSLFEAITDIVTATNYGPSIFTYTGLFNENGKKIYPPCDAQLMEYLEQDGRPFNDIKFFSFAFDNSELIYGLYKYVTLEGEGGTLHVELISIDKKGAVTSFPIYENYSGS